MTLDIPAKPGSYALWLRLSCAMELQIGRFGQCQFPAGNYLYLGSARGSGGLRARLNHHFNIAAHPHWHVDYLRKHAEIRGAFFAVVEKPLECIWSQALAQQKGFSVPVSGFGASDCRSTCPAHLVLLPDVVLKNDLEIVLESVADTHVHFIPSS